MTKKLEVLVGWLLPPLFTVGIWLYLKDSARCVQLGRFLINLYTSLAILFVRHDSNKD